MIDICIYVLCIFCISFGTYFMCVSQTASVLGLFIFICGAGILGFIIKDIKSDLINHGEYIVGSTEELDKRLKEVEEKLERLEEGKGGDEDD